MTDSNVTSNVISAIRALSVDMVEAANSGHPGAPMGLAPLTWTLYSKYLKCDPSTPDWADRDRFVLSAGHASALLYSTLFMAGYDIEMEDLKNFRQLGSITPGHPEYHHTPGVETTTGPLGQGFGNGVGFALAEEMLAARYNTDEHKIIDHHTWVICGDGDLQEGLTLEAASFAGYLGLGKLIVLWDDNDTQLDGPTKWAVDREDVLAKFAASNWRTLEIKDGNDLEEIERVLEEAKNSDGRPTIVKVHTIIGYGAPNKAGTSKAHGAPLGEEEAKAAKEAWGVDYGPFEVPQETIDAASLVEKGQKEREEWVQLFDAWSEENPDLRQQLERAFSGVLPDEIDDIDLDFSDGDMVATRSASHKVINKIASIMPELVGGSADLSGSNKTTIEGSALLEHHRFGGRNIQFGVREHAMASITSGMALHGGLRPFCATFMVFSDYMRGAMRVAALSGIPVIYVLTHDSFHVGEDGPTHQPVETLAALRAIPNLDVIRPADARETLGAWLNALSRVDGPTAILLSRQNLPVLETSSADLVNVGGYELNETEDPDLIFLASGSEVSLAVETAKLLQDEDDLEVRVVSVPEREVFAESDDVDVLLGDGSVPVISIEAAIRMGWEGLADDHVSIETFGMSGPGEEVAEHFGFTPDQVADLARETLDSWD